MDDGKNNMGDVKKKRSVMCQIYPFVFTPLVEGRDNPGRWELNGGPPSPEAIKYGSKKWNHRIDQ